MYARVPISSIWVGALIALLYFFCVLAYFNVVGAPDSPMPPGEPLAGPRFWEIPGWWTQIVNALMIGFAPTVMVHTLRSVEQDVRDLSPALGVAPAAVETEIREVARVNPRTLRRMGLATVAVMASITYLDPGLWSNRERPPLSDPFFLHFLAQQALIGWLWSRAIVADLSTARAFARLSERIRNIDLLDLQRLDVFARRGVRSVLYWMVALVFVSLFWLAPNAGDTNMVPFVLLIALPSWNLTVLLRAAGGPIRAEKEAQLLRIRGAIRADQRALLEGGAGAAEAATRLPALFAAEARIVSVGVLAFDANTVLRFALYVTLGVGSWVGGALIERLLGAALD
jgi:hypothetical protein